ncbi:asparaginase domain-containing protein [Halapricum sp. CBA1109]|uniref:asparaginase domain-containing protein n=1 Tax=Halapricum sp. CBA1109 TaxID=2668068 RepID=UPI001E292040|nr:asparaginase domain-containing protein [Halapricum sp. CBA1109]
MSEYSDLSKELGEEGSMLPNRREFLKMTGAAGSAAMIGNPASADVDGSMVPDHQDKPEVRIVGTGGTIASTQEAADDGGYSLSEQAEAIVESVPILDEFADISFSQPVQKPSPFLTAEDFVSVSKDIMRAAEDGVDGIIVTHGTDAIEEDAFFQDVVLDLDIPVCFVGAMRAADAISADGPANLLSAVRVCTREEFHLDSEPSGVYVVMNETILAARDARKTHTSRVDTFKSEFAGPIGVLDDGEIVLYREPGSYTANLPYHNLDAVSDQNVPIAGTGAGHDAYILEQAMDGEYEVDGIVVETTGNGGTQPDIYSATSEAAEMGIPVGTSTRVYWGAMGAGPYSDDEPGTPVSTEDIPAWNARLLMMVALTATDGHPAIDSDLEMFRKAVIESKYGNEGVTYSSL